MPRKGKTAQPSKRLEKSVKEIVRKEIAEEIEEKHAIVEYDNVPLLPNIPAGVVLPGAGNFFKLMPNVEQSTTGEAGRAYNTRIGNEINLKSLDIKGFLNYEPNRAINFNNSKIGVRVMILRAKEVNDQELLFDNMPTDTLLRFGNLAVGSANGVTDFGGFPLDAVRDINRDTFSVRYDKVHVLKADTVLSGTTSVTTTYTPSGLKMFSHKLTFGQRGLKLKYSSSVDTQANNFPYFMVIGYVSLSANAIPNNNLIQTTFSCVSTYTDA